MTNERAEVLEQQVDELAAQIAELRARLDTMVGVLTNRRLSARLEWDPFEVSALKERPALSILASGKHRAQRDTLAREAERNAAIDRLLSRARQQEQYRRLTGQDLPPDFDEDQTAR